MRWINDVHRQRAVRVAIKDDIAQQAAAGRHDENVRGINFEFREKFFGTHLVAQFHKVAIDERHAGFGIVGVIQRDDQITIAQKIANDGFIAVGADARCRQVFQINDDGHG